MEAMGAFGEKLQDVASHPFLPIVIRSSIFVCSLLSWTITASTPGGLTAPTGFQLCVGVIIWFFSIVWLTVEISTLKDVSLPIPIGSAKIHRVEIMSDTLSAYLAFGSAASVAGVTSSLCHGDPQITPPGSFCSKLVASNVFMWFTWLLQVIPCAIFTMPAIAKAGEVETATVLRAALNTR